MPQLIAVHSLAILHRAWEDERIMKWDRDLVLSHYNTIVNLLCNNDSVMNVMTLLADDDDIDQIQNYIINLRNIFINTRNWSGGESAFHSWQELNIQRLFPTTETARRLLLDMLIVVLNRIKQVFSFVLRYPQAPLYQAHRLRL